jgi:hypothetical protein
MVLLATGAKPNDGEVGEAGDEAELGLEQLASGVEPLRGDGLVVTAALTDEELERGLGEHVASRAMSEVDVADEPDLLEHGEIAMHRCHVGMRDAIGERVGGHRPVGGVLTAKAIPMLG